jgi:hypothetical protein
MNNSPASAKSLSEQTIACLEFFPRWETPLDIEAAKAFQRIRQTAPDFETFRKLAPPHSPDRELVERLWASFEDAGQLIQAGQMREDLFFDSWYELPKAWTTAQPYIEGLRAEQGNPALYKSFEWLGSRAEQFWAARVLQPPQWQPLGGLPPTMGEAQVFATFDHLTPRPAESWAFIERLAQAAPSFGSFQQAIPAGSPDFITIDLVLCAYDRAGVLTKNGILHPALLFKNWRSPLELWDLTRAWIQGLQHWNNSPHLYENVEWLAEFEVNYFKERNR